MFISSTFSSQGCILYIMQNPGWGDDFFINGERNENETHKLNPDHHFISHFSFSGSFPQFLHKIFAQIVSFN